MEQRTTKPEYIEPLLTVLEKLETTTEDELLDTTFQYMKDGLHPLDFQMLPNGIPRWRNQMQHMLDGLMENGKIQKKDGLLILGETLQP